MDCKGGCKMKAGGKTCEKCGCDMEDEEYEKGEKEMRSGGSACMKCGGKMHKSGGTVSSCMKCGGGKYTFGGKVNWSKKKVASNSSEKYASGGMIKRADGSYSERGLWDNIRANAGSGKKPTKQMLDQEKKIKQKMAVGGMVDTGCPPGQMKDPVTGRCVDIPTAQDSTDVMNKSIELSNFYKNTGYPVDKVKPFNENIRNYLNTGNNIFNDYARLSPSTLIQNTNNSDKFEEVQSPITPQTYRKYPNPNKPNVIEQREESSGILNISAPYGYYDTRIKPQNIIKYSSPENNLTYDVAEVAMYDPLAVKPYDTRSSAEHVAYQQKYGNYGGGATPYNPYSIPPPVRLPVTEYTQQDLDRSFERLKQKEDAEKQKALEMVAEKSLQEITKRMELESENRPQEPDYYNMKTIGFSPEDAKIIYDLQGMGPEDGTRGSSAYEKDLESKLRAYKAGRKFAPIPQQVGGYNNIPQHPFTPTEEEVKRFREEAGYRQQWDKEILMQQYGYKDKDFQATNKRKQYSFGGAISSMKQYDPGGEVESTMIKSKDILSQAIKALTSKEKEKNKSKYTGKTAGGYDYYTDKESMPVVNIPDEEMSYDSEGNYDDQLMVKPSKVANTLTSVQGNKGLNTQLDYSLPNWGYGKMEQKKLNELIQAEMKAGAKDLELLVEDDIIGENTLKAMNKFEGAGYTRPEGFKDKWLKKYAEDYAKGVRMQVPGVTAPITPKVPGKESVKTTEIKVEEDQQKGYSRDDFYSDLYDTGKGALEYFLPGIKTSPVKSKKENQTTTKVKTSAKEKDESILPALMNFISGAKSGISGAIGYTGDALNYAIEEGGKFLGKAKEYEKTKNEESAYSNFGKRSSKESAENAESKKRLNNLKSDLSSGYNTIKQLGYDAMTGIGDAYEYGINLAKMGEDLKQQESAKNNFGKRTAKASAENAENRSKAKISEAYKQTMFPISQPMVTIPNTENLPVSTQETKTPETFKSIKDFLFANESDSKKKKLEEAMASNEYKKKIYEESKTIMKLELKTPKTKDDIKYNYSQISSHIDKLDKALLMLSGPTATTDRGFDKMTTKQGKAIISTVGQTDKYRPRKTDYEEVQSVGNEEYDRLVSLKTFLDVELNKINKDSRYKNLDEIDKKAILSKALFNKRKALSDKQFEMKKQLK